jgi:hypothetical protein
MGINDLINRQPRREIKPNDPKPLAIVHFFQLLLRKFFSLVQLNILHVLLNFFVIGFIYIFTQVFIQEGIIGSINLGAPVDQDLASAYYIAKFFLCLFLFCVPVICFGPFQAGFAYVNVCFVNERHTFVFSDYFQKAKENFKKALIISLINLTVFYIAALAINAYLANLAYYGIMGIAVLVFILFMVIIFMMMNMYIWPLLVTVDLSIKDIYKNAITFVYMRFYINLIALVFSFAIFYGTFIYTEGMQQIFIFLLLFLYPALIGFITTFAAYPAIKKNIIDLVKTSK